MCVPRSIDLSTTSPIKSRLKSVLGSVLPTSNAININTPIFCFCFLFCFSFFLCFYLFIYLFIILNLNFLFIYFFCVFRDVSGCSGMFWNVQCSGFYRRPFETPSQTVNNSWRNSKPKFTKFYDCKLQILVYV